MYPPKRPSVTQFYDALSGFRSVHPGKLKFEVQRIKISFTGAKKRQLSVKFQYGNESHMTSLTTKTTARDEYMWFVFRPFLPSLLSLSPG